MSLCGFFKKYFLFILFWPPLLLLRKTFLPSSSVDAAVESAASRVAIYRGNSVKSPGGHMPPNLDVHFQFTCGWYIPILLLLLLSLFCPLRSSLSLLEFFFLAAWSPREENFFSFSSPSRSDSAVVVDLYIRTSLALYDLFFYIIISLYSLFAALDRKS